MKLRPYQSDAVTAAVKDLRSHQKCGLILPTGAGKTEIFIRIALAFLDENPDQSVLVLSHLSILTSQTRERFRKRAPSVSVGVLQGSSTPHFLDDVIISTMQTSRTKSNIDRLNDIQVKTCGLIIIDEAHHIDCSSYQMALSHVPEARVLGCTATPFRDRELMLHWFDRVSYSTSLQEMIDQGYLVKPNLMVVEGAKPDDNDRIGSVVRKYESAHKGQKAIVYLRTQKQAKFCAQLFERSGIKARAILSGFDGSRDDDLKDFAEGDVSVLTTCDVLTAGYDCDVVEIIFMPFSTSSPTKFMQRIGRGLRKADQIGKEKCDVYYYGKAPTFKSNNVSITFDGILKRGGAHREYKTVLEDIEYNDFAGQQVKYEWTKTLVAAIDKLKRKGYPEIAKMLNQKTFPKKYLGDLGIFWKHLKDANKVKTKPTDKQVNYLCQLGFSKSDIERLTKSQASAMISAALNRPVENLADKEPQWRIPEGRHRGEHVRKTPHAYRQHVIKSYPDSKTAKLFSAWYEHQQRRKVHGNG